MLTVVLRVLFFSSRRRHTRCLSDWSSDVCSSDLFAVVVVQGVVPGRPVVPERDRALLPGEPGLEFRPCGVVVEEFQQRLALPLAPSLRAEERRVGKRVSQRGGGVSITEKCSKWSP